MKTSRAKWVAIATSVVGVVVAVVLITQNLPPAAPGAHETAAPSEVDPPTPDPPRPLAPVTLPPSDMPPDEVVAGAEAAAIVEPPLAALEQALTAPDVGVDFSQVADGIALNDLVAEADEYARDGVRQEGTFEVASATITDSTPTSEPPRIVVEVCLDRSNVKTVDTNGNDVSNPEALARVRQLWTMTFDAGQWKLVDRTFTDELEC